MRPTQLRYGAAAALYTWAAYHAYKVLFDSSDAAEAPAAGSGRASGN